MGPIEFALLIGVVFWVVVGYMATTRHMALMFRDELTETVAGIVSDKRASETLKQLAITSFASSTQPFMIFRGIWLVLRGGQPRIDLSDHEQPLFEKLTRQMVQVNLAASPISYFVFAAIFITVMLALSLVSLGRVTGQHVVRVLESAIFGPVIINR